MSENQFEQPGTGRDPEQQPESGAVPPRPATPPSTPAAGSGDGAAGSEGTQPVSRIEGAADPTQALPRHAGNQGQDAPAPGASAQGAPAPGPATGAQQHPYGAPAPAQQPAHAWNSVPQGGSPYGTPTAEEHASAFGAPLPPARKNAPKKFTSGALIVGMVAAAIIGAGGAVGANYVMNSNPMASSSSTTPQGDVVINNPKNVTAVTAAAAKASPSVVTIDVAGASEAGSGSGIILDTAGHILTNTHVVTLGGSTSSPKIAVRTSDGKVHDATVVGTDPLSDLAVIKIEAQDLVPATLGASGNLNVGDTAIAIGAPLGLSGTVTDGIISTLNRTISVASSAVPKQSEGSDSNGNGNQFNFQFPGAPDQQQQQQSSSTGSIFINVIQTDAAINHGNSGGALVDVNGNIIGVNVAIASSGSGATSSSDSGSIGVGFAIPIDYAKRIANDIIDKGSATHGLLGVTVQAKPASANGSNSSSFSVGAEVKDVVADSPAAKAGLKAGDVITGVDARSISDSTSLTAAIREIPAGATTVVHYTRGGAAESTTVTVGETPAQ